MNGVHGAGPDAGQEPSREGRLSEETAERLLRGDPVDTSDPVVRELAALLGAARQAASGPDRAPGCGEPLPGEEAAVAAFRAARTGADGAGALRGLRTVRGAVVAAVAALAFGGVAIAAGTGLIPTPFGDGGPDRPASTPTASAGPTGGPASSTPDGAHSTEVTGGGEDGGSGKGAEPDDGTDDGADDGKDGAPGAGEDGTDAETAVLVGMCRALEASAGGSGEGAPSGEKAERALTEAAGGKDVASFCDGLLEAEERGGPGAPAGNGGAAAGASGGRGSAGQGPGGASEGSGAAGAAAGSGSSGTSGASGAAGSSGTSGASGSSGNSSGGSGSSGSGGAERGGGSGAGGRDGGSAAGASGGGSAAGGPGASAG